MKKLFFYKLLYIFAIGGWLGDLIETIFCKLKYGRWFNRSSFLYGDFSIAWGGAFALASILAYFLEDASFWTIFVIGTVAGGIFEYLCAWISETFLKTKFWDYSQIRFNIKGRINALYCLFWGLAAVIWIRGIFQKVEPMIERIPESIGIPIFWGMLVYFGVNGILALLAIKGYVNRRAGISPRNRIWNYINAQFPDQRVEKVYPFMKICEIKKNSFSV